eukprot:gnl/TRDRNA2_/TRDRNA2_132479_c1_seq2.p1 gnl/TRDRNA2_/TRDRNA2_132479_c1~~gnl/TRDRNA2_/TRDRNA2_132479_c1_seq2.p1  ORF type:complete len:271 (-),score=54.80 gnl/TRDRNA2_/TRDRNA2_132479_c1_seq2:28-744(-)
MRPEHVDAILVAHRQRPLEHYVFISTNMVYPGGPEVFDISGLSPQPVAEDAADLAAADAAPDTYGGRKLKCEAILRRAFETEGLPFTSVRPPAVVGPGCDSRHEKLQRLVQNLPPMPADNRIRPPAARQGCFRVAFGDDVGAVVAGVVGRGTDTHGEAFNVASEESLTMQQYLDAMAAAANCSSSPELPESPALRNYENQGCIDISKAQRLLDFHPTPLPQWMKTTVDWHTPLLRAAI